MNESEPSTPTVLALLACLIVLVALLIFLYKKLNKESNGQYSIQRMVYREGGLRDQLRGAAQALEARLGIQLWPHGGVDNDDDGGQEMRDVRDVEANREPEEDEEEEHSSSSGRERTDDGSSLEGDDEERARLVEEPEEDQETQSKAGDSGGGGGGGAGLLIDLNHFSGSAIWSGEQGDVEESVTGTAL